MDLSWLTDMGASVPDKMIFIIGMMFAAYVLVRDRQKSNQIKLLFEENKECRRLYHQVDKLTYGIAIAIKLKKKVSLIKQSANASGDHALDRDITQ